MEWTKPVLACVIGLALGAAPALARGEPAVGPAGKPDATPIVRFEKERSSARLEPARRNGQPGLAIIFEGTEDLHYYARAETAPSPGLQLKVEAAADGVDFGPAVFPKWGTFRDSTGKTVEVYVGDFRVFVPLRGSLSARQTEAQVTVRIAGIACTSQLCLPPFHKTLTAMMDLSKADTWPQIAPTQAAPPEVVHQAALPRGTPIYFLLAIAAGISINIMPCVLPVLPLILLRLVDQSKRSGGRRVASGFAFAAGVVGFFVVFALVSAIINLTTGAVLDLNSLYRYPPAIVVLFLAIVFFGLVMLDVVALSLPSAITSRQSSGSGITGTVAMGFFAGILSTPCSGALLGFVLVWAQTQPLVVSSTAIVLMGVGMALPYAVLVLVPSLIDRLPKPGHWMEIFKKSTGFLLFFIAVKLTLTALPKERLVNVLTYGIVFSFCAWTWGKWVDFSTPTPKKWTIRILAVAIALGTGAWLLPMPVRSAETAIDWQPYDTRLIEQAVTQNRPVLLDFMADWCTNCKIVDRKVYHDRDIAKLIRAKNVLPIKADTTLIDYPATTDFKAVYGEAGNVPVNIVLLPGGSQEKLRGIFDKEQLVQILTPLPEAGEHGRQEKLSPDTETGQRSPPPDGPIR
jgi:thiol:disulfide interchange protein